MSPELSLLMRISAPSPSVTEPASVEKKNCTPFAKAVAPTKRGKAIWTSKGAVLAIEVSLVEMIVVGEDAPLMSTSKVKSAGAPVLEAMGTVRRTRYPSPRPMGRSL